MTSYRLTKYDRSIICKNAIADRFGKKEETLKEEKYNLSDQAYNMIFDKDILDKINSISRDWLYTNTNMYIRLYNGYQFELHFKTDTPLPGRTYHFSDSKFLLSDQDLCDKLLKNHSNMEDLKKEKRDAEYKLKSLLNSVSTTKQLKEIWPDGEPFYAHLVKNPKMALKTNLPAILISDINKIFELPKQEAA